jgi:hypothetical protein
MSAAKVIQTWPNGAKRFELDGIQFVTAPDGRISWATPDGWARIAVDRETFPIMKSYTVWQSYGPTYGDDEYTYAGPMAGVTP